MISEAGKCWSNFLAPNIAVMPREEARSAQMAGIRHLGSGEITRSSTKGKAAEIQTTTRRPWSTGRSGVWLETVSRNLAGNPDPPQAVVFLTSIIDETVGIVAFYMHYWAI